MTLKSNLVYHKIKEEWTKHDKSIMFAKILNWEVAPMFPGSDEDEFTAYYNMRLNDGFLCGGPPVIASKSFNHDAFSYDEYIFNHVCPNIYGSFHAFWLAVNWASNNLSHFDMHHYSHVLPQYVREEMLDDILEMAIYEGFIDV